MKKPFGWTAHARFRMHLRRIPGAAIEKVLARPVARATDTLTGYSVVVGNVSYGGQSRMLAVVYEETEQGIQVVTAHPIRASQYRMRLHRGRWKPK